MRRRRVDSCCAEGKRRAGYVSGPEGRAGILLVHPGGPLWETKDAGIWSIPKGEIHTGEDLLEAAKREFEEELGFKADGPFIQLSPIKQRSGKIVHPWAFAGDCDPAGIRSNMFSMGGGRIRAAPAPSPRWTGHRSSTWSKPRPESFPPKWRCWRSCIRSSRAASSSSPPSAPSGRGRG